VIVPVTLAGSVEVTSQSLTLSLTLPEKSAPEVPAVFPPLPSVIGLKPKVPPGPQLGLPPPVADVHVWEKSSTLAPEMPVLVVITMFAFKVKAVSESTLQLHVPIVNG
jgi:hypothetical protein